MRDLWERTLSQISTLFGQMTYLASLRDALTGRYVHYGLSQIYGDEAANRAINDSHERIFAEWLNFPLDKQRSDLEVYLEDAQESRSEILKSWGALAPYKNLAPAGAGDAEKYLFVADLEIILELLQNELSSSS
jgi:hypothetical protein